MVARLIALIRKEFIQMTRDPRTLGMVLMLPVMQLLLFGYAINTVVDHMPTVVFDESDDADSRALIAAFENSHYFDVNEYARSAAGLTAAIDAGDAKVGLHIPPDFGDLVLRGQAGPIQLIVDGSDPNVASTATFAAGTVAQSRSVDMAAATLARLGRGSLSGGIDLRPVVLYNPSMLSANFMVPGIIGLILQFQTLLLTSFAIVRERERGTLEQLIVTPIRRWELMFGKIVPYTVTAAASAAVAMVAGRLLFGVEVAGSLPLLTALSVLFLLGSLGLGLLISTSAQTQVQAMQMTMFITLPSIMLSGFMYPRDNMPFIVQQLGLVIPLTYYLEILRGIMLKGVGLEVIWASVVPLAIFGLGVFALSAQRFQKRVG